MVLVVECSSETNFNSWTTELYLSLSLSLSHKQCFDHGAIVNCYKIVASYVGPDCSVVAHCCSMSKTMEFRAPGFRLFRRASSTQPAELKAHSLVLLVAEMHSASRASMERRGCVRVCEDECMCLLGMHRMLRYRCLGFMYLLITNTDLIPLLN